MASFADQIKKAFPRLAYKEDVPYSELTTLGVGTSLPFLAEPADKTELAGLLAFLFRRKIPFFIFGGGSNVIGMDTPYQGAGLRLGKEGFSYISVEKNVITCGARTPLPELVKTAAANGLGGLSCLAGIPGTVGGAVKMNAGANGGCIGEHVTALSGLTAEGKAFSLAGEEMVWAYRKGAVPQDCIVCEITLTLENTSAAAEEKVIREVLDSRREREPGGRTAGCAFRNVSETESAGKLIDLCGLKGVRCEDMQISEKHANYMVNLTGNAAAQDYLKLLIFIRRAVSDRWGFFLKLEQIPVDETFEKILYSEVPAIKVNVLYGGESSEREVSLRSGKAVAGALCNGGFEVELTDIRRCGLTTAMKTCDVIYPVLHGGFGEDGRIQKVMEDNCLRFTCSGSDACQLVMDKIITKRLLDKTKLPTAPWKIITREECAFPEELGLPVILKVPCEGSTVGIIKVDTREEWDNALEEEFKLADTLLAEAFVKGVEISIPVLGGQALDAIEIRSPKGFYDYDAKYVYNEGHTEYFCPPVSLEEEKIRRAQHLAEEFYFITGCRDLVRVDFIVAEDGVPYILEGNTLPGCTATSLVPKAARVKGISFEALTSQIVYSAMRRPAPRPVKIKKADPLSGTLAGICIWMFRITLVLCALVLASSGIVSLLTGLPGWPLVLAGVLMVFTELIFSWLKSMEKK